MCSAEKLVLLKTIPSSPRRWRLRDDSSKMASLPFKTFRGFRIPKGAREDYFEWIADYRACPGDVFVVSFPKCGTTWLQHVVYLLAKGGQPADSIEQVVTAVPFPEQDGAPKGPTLALKTHLPMSLMKLEPEAKYLYIARNPKDACVSYYHFLKNLPGYQIESFDAFFEAFLTGRLPHGDILDHILPWHEASHQLPNVLFLTYEDLSTDREKEVARVAKFLGHDLLDEQVLKEVVRCTSFGFMRALASKDSFMRGYLRNSTGMEGEGAEEPRMMRKGVVGDWINHLSPKQNERMNTHFKNKTRGTGMEGLWANQMR